MMNRSTISSAVRTAGGVLAVVALALTVLMVAPQAVGAEASYVVLSDSMSPAIEAGDVVVVHSVDPERIDRGDVITFTESGRSITDDRTDRVTHRVVGVERGGDGFVFTTKGDANEEADREPVTESQVVGRVWFHLPLVGHAVLFAGTRLGLLLLVVLPGVALVVSEVYSLYTDALVEVDDESDGNDRSDDDDESLVRAHSVATPVTSRGNSTDGGAVVRPDRTGIRLGEPIGAPRSQAIVPERTGVRLPGPVEFPSDTSHDESGDATPVGDFDWNTPDDIVDGGSGADGGVTRE